MTKSKYRPKQNERKDRVKKKKKLSIVFDPDARKEYLTGFQKRKQEKKARYRTHLEKKVAAEKSRLKEQAKKSLSFRSSSHSILPEVENLLADQAEPQFSKTTSHEIGSKTVTISTIDTLHPIISEITEDNPDEDEGDDDQTAPAEDQAKMKSMLKKTTNQLLQRSKAFKAVQKLKTKKAQRKQRQRSTGSASKKDDKKSGGKKTKDKKDDKGPKFHSRSGKNKKGKKK